MGRKIQDEYGRIESRDGMEALLNQYRRQPGECGLGDVEGELHVKQILRGCIPNPQIDKTLGINGTHAILLYGEAGNGKMTLTEALAHEIAKTGTAFCFVQLPAWVLVENSEQETCDRIWQIFAELSGQPEASVLIAIGDIDLICRQPSAVWVLSWCIGNLLEQEMSCTVVLTVNDIKLIPGCLFKTVVPCKIEKPDLEARKKYFKRTLTDRIRCERGLTADMMAQMTYGFSYSQLHQCIVLIMLQIKYEMMMMGGIRSLTKRGVEMLIQNLRQAGNDARTLVSAAENVHETVSESMAVKNENTMHTISEDFDDTESLMRHWEDLPDELDEW